MIVFNGNAGHRGYRAPLAAALDAQGIAVLLFDYRGYGGNPGTPAEAGLFQDARAARAYVISRPDVDASRLVYFGESLGSGVATALAAENPPAALILRSPFASMVEVGRIHYPLLPVGGCCAIGSLRSSTSAASAARCSSSPARDTIVPFAQSRRLFDAALEPKRLLIIEGADHNDEALNAGPGLLTAVTDFVRGL